ncbi:PREDICTED: pathogenesis-related protein 5-like, partial [Brassica oleracea var. oleracea]
MQSRFNLSPRILLLCLTLLSGTKWSDSARVFTIVNSCNQVVWPAITPGESFNGGGFELKPGQSMVFNAPVGWSGRIWGRTGCNFDKTGTGTCETGSCGSTLKCSASGKPPASLAEFTLATPDFYDVSLVDGFNLPMSVTPLNGKGNCSVAGCVADLRPKCPRELAVK